MRLQRLLWWALLAALVWSTAAANAEGGVGRAAAPTARGAGRGARRSKAGRGAGRVAGTAGRGAGRSNALGVVARAPRPEPKCNIELTSLLKSGSTWTEIVIFSLLETACGNDPGCSFTKTHLRGRSAHNRTVGFDLNTDNERPGVAWQMCNASVRFDSQQKHVFWGTSFYREGVSERRSIFSLLENLCVKRNHSVSSPQCLRAIAAAAPDRELKHNMQHKSLSIACLRDPRAVAVSECHWMGRAINNTDLLRKPCHETNTHFDTLVYATGFLYNYWKNVIPTRSHVVVYEKMLIDPEGEYRAIADFLGIGRLVSNDEIASLARNTTAAALAKKEAEGKLLGKTKVAQYNGAVKVQRVKNHTAVAQTGFEYLDGAKVYRGTAKGFMEDVTETELNAMNRKMRRHLPKELLELFGVPVTGPVSTTEPPVASTTPNTFAESMRLQPAAPSERPAPEQGGGAVMDR